MEEQLLSDLEEITPIISKDSIKIQNLNFDNDEFRDLRSDISETNLKTLHPSIYTKNTSEYNNSSLFISSPYTIFPKTINSTLRSFLSFTIQPLKKIKIFDEEIPPKLIHKSEDNIARCELCNGYLSPFCIVSFNRDTWICKMCNTVNKFDKKYFDYMQGSFDEKEERIELTREVFDYRVPGNYYGSYDVHKDKVLILLEISNQSLIECIFIHLFINYKIRLLR